MDFKRNVYLKNMDELGAVTYGGNGSIGYHITKGFSNIDIDNEFDFQLAEAIVGIQNKEKEYYES